MTINKVLIALSLGLLMAACTKPMENVQTNNSGVAVQKMFDIENCTMYRWTEGEFLICKNGNAMTSTTEQCGKNCRTTVVTPTVLVNGEEIDVTCEELQAIRPELQCE